MRQALHCIFVLLGFACGVIVFPVGTVGFGCLYASYLIHPNSRGGNCWSFAVPRWIRFGGYLNIRLAEDVKFLKIFPILHVQWGRKTPQPGAIKQFIPRTRIGGKWFPYWTIYFPGRVVSIDTNHDAEEET